MIISFSWNYITSLKNRENLLLKGGRSFFEHIVYARAWNAGHGGVYVPVVKGKTEPNPYLEDPRRDIRISKDLTLTKINPAFMTRQISEIVSKHDGVKFHITSLKPIRPLNKPDELEGRALRLFEKGEKEFSEIIYGKGEKPVFFYMAPLTTTKACLQCHAGQGYVEGDIRGGISITVPLSDKGQFLQLFLLYSVLGLAGFTGIRVFSKKLEEAYEIIHTQAIIDGLTQVPNRRSFDEYFTKEFKRGQRSRLSLSLIICDIDLFKKYNDTYGHQEGDKCLQRVAKQINDEIKRPADFCARYGGEEFVILLPNTDLEGACHIAERVRKSIEELRIINGSENRLITLSLGLAECSFDSENCTQEMLVKKADDALYRAKENGRNRVEKDPSPL